MSGKLKNIYEAIDHYNYKGALKLCTGFLQKHPKHALCKALQAVCLERCGRRDEALRVADEAHSSSSSADVDDTVLSTVEVVYRRCRQTKKGASMYEDYLAMNPDDEELAVATFAAVCRPGGDFAKAQQVASKLYGKFKKPKYLHWVVVSILLQVQRGGPVKVLDLAAMMLLKAPVTAEPDAPFNRGVLYLLLLHLSTLRLQGKPDKALEMLKAHEGVVKLPADIAALRIQLQEESGEQREAAREARALVVAYPDSWAAAQEYIRLAFACPAPPGLPCVCAGALGCAEGVEDQAARLRRKEVPDALPSLADVESHATEDEAWNALLLFRHLGQPKDAPSTAERTARLAELHLRRTALRRNEAALASAAAAGSEPSQAWSAVRAAGSRDIEELVSGMVAYVERFAQRNNCYFDLKPFLCFLEAGEVSAVLDAASKVASAEGGKAGDAAITTVRLRRGVQRPGRETPLAEMAAEVERLLREWTAQQKASGKAPEELLLLAAVNLVDMDRAQCRELEAGGRGYLLDALALAELGLSLSPLAFNFKVLIVLINGALGLPGAALKCFGTMDIKNVQHETLSYLVLDSLQTSGGYEGILKICGNVLAFHEDIDKDGQDVLLTAFQSGVYQRVPEYLDMLEKAGKSANWVQAAVGEIMAEMGQATTFEAVADCVGRSEAMLSMVSTQPTDHWIQGSQDRCLLNGLHPVPLCSPAAAEGAHSAQVWLAGGAAPPSMLLGSRRGVVGSSALDWGSAVARGDSKAMESAWRGEASAAEELLAKGFSRQAAHSRFSASLLSVVAALLRPSDQQREEAVGAALQAAREAGAVDGAPRHLAPAADAGDASSAAGSAWFPAAAGCAERSQKCALRSCEAAHTILRCAAGAEAWEQAEKQLTEVIETLQGLVENVRDMAPASEVSGEERSASFGLGLLGVPRLWSLLDGCLAFAVPVAIWCCTAMPKAKKEGQEGLRAARVAVRTLLAALSGGLMVLLEDLQAAHGSDEATLLPPSECQVAALAELPDFAKRRSDTRAAAVEAHRRHLQSLKEAVAAKVILLKAQKSFKP